MATSGKDSTKEQPQDKKSIVRQEGLSGSHGHEPETVACFLF
jgi:hypothetical protein